MESYVEISWLYNVLTIVLCVMLASYSSMQPIRSRDALLYAGVVSLAGVSLYMEASLYIVLAGEMLFFITMFHRRRKLYMFAMAYRFFLYLSCFAWCGGSMHNALLFLSVDTNPIYIFLIYALFAVLLQRKWKSLLASSNYVYDVWLYTNDSKIKLKGYLDSGNLLSHEELPVIFLDQHYQTYFDDSCIQLVVMNTVEKAGVISCYPCRIQLNGCGIHEAFVSCEKHLHLPFDCVALLNMKLMTLG